MPPPQSFVAPPTPLLRVKWAADWPISRSPSVSQTKTSGYSQTPEEKQKISLSERRRERGGEGFGNKLCRSPNREKKEREGGEREKMWEKQRKHIKLLHSARWIHLPYPWSTFELYSCGRCGCIQGAASKPLHPPELALPHPPLWWFSHDDTTDKNGIYSFKHFKRHWYIHVSQD